MKPVTLTPAFYLGHYEIKTLLSPTVVCLLLGVTQAKCSSICKLRSANFRVEEVKILLPAKRLACPVRRLFKCAKQSTLKCLILAILLNLCLLRNMSVRASDDLRDHGCKRGKVTQQPPISYAQFKFKPWISEPNKIKIKVLEGVTLSYVT